MLFRIVSLLYVLACSAPAATGSWAAIEAAHSHRVQIMLTDGKVVSGSVDHVTPTALFISNHGRTTEVAREDVVRVSRKTSSRMKWAMIGAAIGAGAGGATSAAILEREPGLRGAVAGTVGVFAGIGAGVGYLAGHGRLVVIYESANPAADDNRVDK